MNCFLASAFDYPDVDRIYDRGIMPVLSKLKIKPLRVDRVEHNDDIDDKIFEMINQSQVCIADLTFARPSVYYEAGYASGLGKPVIFIARNDHFKSRDDDPMGNLRVHFDLQMKNIIKWTEPNNTFKNKLSCRLNHVLRPILQEQKKSQALVEEERLFSKLSQNDRLKGIMKKSESLIRVRGYKKFKIDYIYYAQPYRDHFRKTSGEECHTIHIVLRHTINRTDAEGIKLFLHPNLELQEQGKVKKVDTLTIIPSLNNFRSNTLKALFPSWSPISDRIFKNNNLWSFDDDISHKGTLAIIDGIKSIEDFAYRLRTILAEFN
jgi:nucleoside 2-deoxyribosyltransferase